MNNQVKFYHKTSQAKIPNWDGQTVANYWDNMEWQYKKGANGVTVTTGGKFDDMGNPNPNGIFTDARKFNTVIMNTLNDNNQLERTLLHEFMHWEVSGNHVAIADGKHLDLARFGYENLNNDEAASSAINEFLKNGCK
ncbi:MAG: hypothetical protein IPO77_19490 [Acidobacteria bacterium]|nr:hypothetical protein [Acidobacteriota bacterium]